MVFKAINPDYDKSPYTGLVREHWIEAGEYLLKGMFQNIQSFQDPLVMPRKETKISYPHGENNLWEIKAEIFEGLARSFFIAAPLIHINPELTICNYKIREYYKSHVLRACTKGDPLCVGSYRELREMAGDTNSFRAFQQTVETCALVICLWMCQTEIWDTYTREEKDTIAAFLTDFAHGNTVPQNWRLFNMLDMAFLHKEGYPIDREIMLDHAQTILGYYAGDGWYRDGHSFDYYSCWAFNVYTPIWNLWYGYENEPYLAGKFEENSNQLMETFADFFDKDGFVNMWGRSNIYRNAATSAFSGNMLLTRSKADPGLARRISSGALLQFLTREDLLYKGIPTLGFYGQFTPLVQGYSCAESPFWLGKAFLCLCLPEDHPFWSAREHNGTWETLPEKAVKVTTLSKPALCFSNHAANGETILRTGKIVKNLGAVHDMWNYSKLSFNTKYPWQAGSLPDVESQQYVLKNITDDTFERCNATFWCGEKEGVLYRRQFFDYSTEKECHWMQALNLADFTVPNGLIRADKLRLYKRPVSITLGAYGFPDNGTEILHLEEGNAKAIILKGHDFTGREKQLAMTLYDGWDEISLLHSEGTNPDSEKSIVIYGKLTRSKQYGYEPYLMISQVITKESLEDFTKEEIFPIADITYTDQDGCGGYGAVTITLKDGGKKIIDFEGIEGIMQL